MVSITNTAISASELCSRSLPPSVGVEIQLRWVRVRSTSLSAVGLENRSCGAAYQYKSHNAYPNAYLLVLCEAMKPGRLGWLSS